MAVLRDNPYGACNFVVNLGGAQGTGEPGTVVGGFREVTGLGFEIAVTEYRNGNEKTNTERKGAGLTTYSDVVLRRGVIGSTDLFEWAKGIANGVRDVRTVTITLLDEAHEPVLTWKLRNAWPRKYSAPDLNSQSNEVAIEEIVLVHEGLELD